MEIKIEKLNNTPIKNDLKIKKLNLVKIIKETSHYKNRKDSEIVVLNYNTLNEDKELFNKIKNSYQFNEATELILIDKFYNFDKNNQFVKLHKHKNLNNKNFYGVCYFHSIWISDNGITMLGIFEKVKIGEHEMSSNTVNINFDLGVIDIFGYISYESFVNGYKFAMDNYDVMKNETHVELSLFHEKISETINTMKENYYKF